MLAQVILITFIAGVLGTGTGGLLGALFCRDSDKVTSLLVSFAAGIMLSVVCFNMIQEAIMPENASRQMSILLVEACIVLGFFMVWGLDLGMWKTGIGKRFDLGKDSSLLTAGIVMILAISIHNLPEGMVIGASYAADAASPIPGSVSAGLILAIVIGIHDIPEGMAVAVALVNGGVSRLTAVLLTACSGLPTVIGAFAGWKLGTMGPVMLSLMLSFAAGAMLYVVIGELIPKAREMWDSQATGISMLAGLLTGMVIIFA